MLNEPIVDGFLYNQNYRPLLGYSQVLTLAQLEPIRRVKGYKPRYYVVPEDATTVIPAREAFEYQVYTNEGCILWGLYFANPNGLYSLQIVDMGSNNTLYSENTLGSGLYDPGGYIGPILLSSPAYISAPNLLSVELGSLDPNPSGLSTVQLVLLCMEPICNIDNQ